MCQKNTLEIKLKCNNAHVIYRCLEYFCIALYDWEDKYSLANLNLLVHAVLGNTRLHSCVKWLAVIFLLNLSDSN